jgi:alcohol dehydrogenase class IV
MNISDLISAVKARQDEIAKALALGSASNWDAVQRLVGEVQGLQRALDIINNLLEKEENE